MAGPTEVYVEVGDKRAFAGAIEWPGWCRTGRREDDALDLLLAYGTRYADVLAGSVRGFTVPRSRADLTVVERLTGDATTDFGAPSVAPAADERPLGARGPHAVDRHPRGVLGRVRRDRGGGHRPGAPQGAARRRARARRHRRSRDRSGDLIRGEAGRASPQDGGTGPAGRRHGRASGRPRRAVPRGRRRTSRARAPRRQDLAASLLRSPRRVARARSRVGDRGSPPTTSGARRIPV